jgi:putative ABC transport system permease protein
MTWLRQTIAVMLINLQTIPSRLGSSIVAIIGIAGVVIVFVSVLSISSGFSSAMMGTGSADRALILRKGVDTEMTSGLEGTEVRIIREAPGIRYDGDTPLVSSA